MGEIFRILEKISGQYILPKQANSLVSEIVDHMSPTQDDKEEFLRKWKIGDEIYMNRGTVAYEAYSMNDIVKGWKNVSLDKIPPAKITIYENASTSSEWKLSSLVDRTGAKTFWHDFPYYSVIVGRNVVQLLQDALDDLTTLSNVLRSA